jgi:hypothetical protein
LNRASSCRGVRTVEGAANLSDALGMLPAVLTNHHAERILRDGVPEKIYLSLWRHSFSREGRDPDQHDAYSAAAWMRRADLGGRLAAFLNPSLATPERAVAQVEGWILGVA